MVSLDGVSDDLLEGAFQEGRLSPLAAVWKQGGVAPLSSSIPPISSVAWATYATGVNPGGHGIYGFVDRDPRSMDQYIPTARDVAAPTLWARLGEAGLKPTVINLPLTYPAQPFPGTLVAGFPAPELRHAAHPPELAHTLIDSGYLVDPDPRLASDPPAFFAEVKKTIACRRRLALRLLKEDWNLFHLHIMATDRLNHFFLRARLSGTPYHQDFWSAYEDIAELVGEVVEGLPKGTELVLMSDHGFSEAEWQVDLNRWLLEKGLLRLEEGGAGPRRVAPDSVAYSLTPGRVYLMREGRERGGWITPREAPYNLERVREALLEVRTPDGGPAVAEVFWGEEIYRGPRAALGPDLVAIPTPSVELRGGWEGKELAQPAPRQGCHTLEGAFLWIRDREPKPGNILDVPPTLWSLLRLPLPGDFEGKVLI
ncbi:alkaline phosphatase family protein [Candidatus Bipolaricaulota bacterium]|nr:alkaline phosphatase family protein [Candidatus Bipolaricaulota bacterium]